METWADCWAAEFMIREPPPMDEAMEYMDIRLLAAMIVAGNWGMLSLGGRGGRCFRATKHRG